MNSTLAVRFPAIAGKRTLTPYSNSKNQQKITIN